MRTLLPGLAATLAIFSAPAIPAHAEGRSGADNPAPSVTVHRDHFGRGHDGRFDRWRRDRSDQTVVLPFGYYDERFASRSWEPDSYNDWWHDRPERSYPRWMQNNRGCERQWWSGGGWTC